MPVAIDTAVLLSYFVVIIWIGLYMGRKGRQSQKTSHSAVAQFRGGPVLASIMRRKLAPPPFRYRRAKASTIANYIYLQLALGTILARILVSYIFIKALLRLQSLFDLRISHRAHSACRRKKRGIRYFHGYARAGVRYAPVCSRDRASACV